MRVCPNTGDHFLSRKKGGALCLGAGAILAVEGMIGLIASDNGAITNTQPWKIYNFAALVFGCFIFGVGYYLRHDFNMIVSVSLKASSRGDDIPNRALESVGSFSGGNLDSTASSGDKISRPPTTGTPLFQIREASIEASLTEILHPERNLPGEVQIFH